MGIAEPGVDAMGDSPGAAGVGGELIIVDGAGLVGLSIGVEEVIGGIEGGLLEVIGGIEGGILVGGVAVGGGAETDIGGRAVVVVGAGVVGVVMGAYVGE